MELKKPGGSSLRVIPRASEESEAASEGTNKAQPKRRVTNPEVEAWNRRFTSDPGGAPVTDAPERKRDALSEPAAPKGNRRIVIIAACLVIGAVLVVVRGLAGSRAPREVPPIAEAHLLDEAIASEIEARASVENAPPCYTTDEGFHFDYRGSRGELHSVERIVDVPVLYRGVASCVRD